jgi:transcriptional regulator with GAF, ATPase, and Fis domain
MKTSFLVKFILTRIGSILKKKYCLNIENVNYDTRYNPDTDNKFQYNDVKSVFIFPIVNKNNESIGVIQAFNKRNKHFDQSDEVITDYLSKLVQLQVKQSIEYSDLSVYVNKMKKFIDVKIIFYYF